MFTIGLLAAAICLLLAIFSVMHQALEQKRTEKRLRIAGWHRRAAQLHDLFVSFPQGYLSRDLAMFLHQSVIELCEKIHQLDSSSPCRELLQQHREEQNALLQSPDMAKPKAALKTPQQIKEVKVLLKDLVLVINSALENNYLTRVQANQFKQQLQHMMLIINLESYQQVAREAEGAGKLQVAIHYHEQSKKLLQSRNADAYKTEIEHFEQLIKKLTDRLAQQTATKKTAKTEPASGTRHHTIINDESDPGKKKQIYD